MYDDEVPDNTAVGSLERAEYALGKYGTRGILHTGSATSLDPVDPDSLRTAQSGRDAVIHTGNKSSSGDASKVVVRRRTVVDIQGPLAEVPPIGQNQNDSEARIIRLPVSRESVAADQLIEIRLYNYDSRVELAPSVEVRLAQSPWKQDPPPSPLINSESQNLVSRSDRHTIVDAPSPPAVYTTTPYTRLTADSLTAVDSSDLSSGLEPIAIASGAYSMMPSPSPPLKATSVVQSISMAPDKPTQTTEPAMDRFILPDKARLDRTIQTGFRDKLLDKALSLLENDLRQRAKLWTDRESSAFVSNDIDVKGRIEGIMDRLQSQSEQFK